MIDEFTYVRSRSVRDAAAILTIEADAKLLAGGMSLLSAMKLRLSAPSHLVDLGRIAPLKAIQHTGAHLSVGAMARHVDVETSDIVTTAIPALAELAGGIGDRQVRHRGTLGGSLANADPAACYPAAVLALDATIETDRRTIAAANFFTGIYETALQHAEIISAVKFRIPRRAAYTKFRHPASRFAVVGVFVSEFGDGDVRVAVTGAFTEVFRSVVLETALAQSFSPDAARAVAVPWGDFNSDHNASAEYRGHLVSEMAARAVDQAVRRNIP